MEITVLGTANAWGANEIAGAPWPLTGALSDGTEVEFRKYRASLLVCGDDGTRVLIDCGPDFAHQRRQFDVGVPDAIFITHSHFDHIGGLSDCFTCKNAGHPRLPTYAHPDCWTVIRRDGFAYLVDTADVLDERHLTPSRGVTVGGLTVTPFAVDHAANAPGALGFVIDEAATGARLIYSGDLWRICDPDQELFHRPADVLIIECDRVDQRAAPDIGGGHMSLEEILVWLESGLFSRVPPKQITLVHFGDNGPCGVTSTYADWRNRVLNDLADHDLAAVANDADSVIGYSGMRLELPRGTND
jgi:phosphoribosyl 1,2-cyclic phosphodiesterase